MRRPWGATGYRTRRRGAARRGAARGARRLAAGLGLIAALAGLAAGAPAVGDFVASLRPMTTGCSVLRVIDGDTVDLRCPGAEAVRARIDGYDSPELVSPGCAAEAEAAEAARRALGGMVGASWVVEVAFLGTDRYGREIVDMRLDGQRVATRMVEGGHGRRYLGGLRGGWCG